jgi:uncharacterized protein
MKKALATLLLAMVVLSGCAGTEPTRFYLLTPKANPVPVTGTVKENGLTIVIGAVRLPEYLNRSQIVTRVSDNEVELGWQDRWAEPLERNFTRALAQNLEQLLFCRCPSALTAKSPPGITHRVEADVMKMDGILGQKAYLEVRWSVYDPDKRLLLSRRSSLVHPVNGTGYEAFVRAQSAALFDFSREVATAIVELQRGEVPGKKGTVDGR